MGGAGEEGSEGVGLDARGWMLGARGGHFVGHDAPVQGQRPAPYQPGPSAQGHGRETEHRGLKACPMPCHAPAWALLPHDGPGFQPFTGFIRRYPERCSGLVWGGPLALGSSFSEEGGIPKGQTPC